jgi:putative transposase
MTNLTDSKFHDEDAARAHIEASRWANGVTCPHCGSENVRRMGGKTQAGMFLRNGCRKHGISSPTFYAWKAKYGGLDVSQARKLKVLEDENARLKKLLAEAMLDNAVLKEVGSKNW